MELNSAAGQSLNEIAASQGTNHTVSQVTNPIATQATNPRIARLIHEIQSLELSEQIPAMVWTLAQLASNVPEPVANEQLSATRSYPPVNLSSAGISDALDLWGLFELCSSTEVQSGFTFFDGFRASTNIDKSPSTAAWVWLMADHVELVASDRTAIGTPAPQVMHSIGKRWVYVQSNGPNLTPHPSHLHRCALFACAILFGLAERASIVVSKFCGERRQGGRLIQNWSAVADSLDSIENSIKTLRGRLTTKIESALIFGGSSQEPSLASSTESKDSRLLLEQFTQSVPQLLSDALELMGGAGYMRDYPLADLYLQSHLLASLMAPSRGST